MKTLGQFLIQMARYSGGLVAAYLMAGVILFVMFFAAFAASEILVASNWIRLGFVFSGLVVIGYSCVTVATHCTDSSSHHVTSWFYTFLGAVLFCHHHNDGYLLGKLASRDMSWTIVLLSFLLVGGIAASLRFTIRYERAQNVETQELFEGSGVDSAVGLRTNDEIREAAGEVDLTGSISADDAHLLATAYLHCFVTSCGVIGHAEEGEESWSLPTYVGILGSSGGPITVDKITGAVGMENGPTLFPQDFASGAFYAMGGGPSQR